MTRILFFLILCAATLRADDVTTDKSLGDVFAERGVTEQTNTLGHVFERTTAGLNGRIFHLNDPILRAPLWEALRKTKYVKTQQDEPKEPYLFAVLNTGTSTHDLPVVEFWVDSLGFAYCLVDHEPRRQRTYLVFRAQELQELLSSYSEKFGKPLP